MAEPIENESVSASGNTVRPLNKEEMEALTADLQEVLIKHGAEMGVTSTINLMKVLTPEVEDNEKDTNTEGEPEAEKADSSPEEGS